MKIEKMPKLYDIYKKNEKRLSKYALYVKPEDYENVFSFFRSLKPDQKAQYGMYIVSKTRKYVKECDFINYDNGVLVYKKKSGETKYEYIKHYYLFVENHTKTDREDQMEKYAPIHIDIDLDLDKKREKDKKEKRKKKKKHHPHLESTLESILEENEEEEEENI